MAAGVSPVGGGYPCSIVPNIFACESVYFAAVYFSPIKTTALVQRGSSSRGGVLTLYSPLLYVTIFYENQ